jgi:hypothetical protein
MQKYRKKTENAKNFSKILKVDSEKRNEQSEQE